MFIIKYKKYFLGFTVVLTTLALFAVLFYGIKLSIDFTGGSLVEVAYKDARPSAQTVVADLAKAGFKESTVQPSGAKDFVIRTKSLTEKDHAAIINAINKNGTVQIEEKQFSSIGPVIGSELRAKAWASILTVLAAIILYIAFAFRKVSAPVSSAKYGVIAVIALAHDIIVPLGVLAVLSHFMGVETDILFITALLTILGFSVHDTIVVFDRVRENLKNKLSPDFATVVGLSINQTVVRSINTSLTVALVLSVLIAVGPASTYYFSLFLLIGVISGTYSSVFIASPLLVVAQEMMKNKKPAVQQNQNKNKK